MTDQELDAKFAALRGKIESMTLVTECSFCGRSDAEAHIFIALPTGQLICDDCIELLGDILALERAQRVAAAYSHPSDQQPDKCRMDHFVLIMRHVEMMIGEIRTACIHRSKVGIAFDEAEEDERFTRSIRAFFALYGQDGWPVVYDDNEEYPIDL